MPPAELRGPLWGGEGMEKEGKGKRERRKREGERREGLSTE